MFKNAIFYTVGGLASQLLISFLWLYLPYLQTTSVIGGYNISNYYIDLFSVIILLGTDSVILRYYFIHDSKDFVLKNVIAIIILTYIICVLFFSFILFFDIITPPLFFKIYFFQLALIFLLNSFVNIFLIHLNAIKNAKLYVALQFLKSFFFCLFTIILSKIGLGIDALLYSLIISMVIFLYLFFNKNNINFKSNNFDKKLIISFIKYGLPLCGYSIMGVFSLYTTRLVIQKYMNLQSLGIYSFFLVLILQLNGLLTSFNKAWTPDVFSRITKINENEFVFELSKLVLVIFLTIYILVIFIGNLFFFDFLFKPEYKNYLPVFFILFHFPMYNSIYTILYPLFYFEEKTYKILYISILTTILNIIISYFLIKYFLLYGAAISTVIIGIVNLLLYLTIFKKDLNIRKSYFSFIFYLILTSSFSIFCLYYYKSFYLYLSLLLVILVTIIFFFKIDKIIILKYNDVYNKFKFKTKNIKN